MTALGAGGGEGEGEGQGGCWLTFTRAAPALASQAVLGAAGSRVTARTANSPSARSERHTEPPCAPVAPKTVTTFFWVIIANVRVEYEVMGLGESEGYKSERAGG